MTAGPPAWRKTYDAVEKQVGGPLGELMRSDLFADLLGVTTRTRTMYLRLIERSTRRALHRWNLPAASDVTRLQQQIAALQREVAALPKRVQGQLDARPRSAELPASGDSDSDPGV